MRKVYLLVPLLILLAFSSVRASISVSISPDSLPANEQGTALVTISTLASPGNKVWVDIFIDANKDGIIDSGEAKVESFALTDGIASPEIGGTPNTNVYGDEDVINSQITTTLKFYDPPYPVGQYIIQVTDMGDSSTAKATFTFTQTATSQSISGTVTCNGSPVAGAFVYVEGSNWCDAYAAITDSNGDYTIYLDSPGTYSVDVSARGYLGKDIDGDSYLGCIIVDGHETGINLKLFDGNRHITGTIKDKDTNQGIAGVWIEAEAEIGGTEYYSETITNHDGSFDIIVIDGIWELEVDEEGLQAKGYVGTDDAYPNDIMVSGSNVPGQDASFPYFTALIAGTVKDEKDNPVAAEIEAEAEISGVEYWSEAITNPTTGDYVLGVIAGDWEVDAEPLCELYLRKSDEQYHTISDGRVLNNINFTCPSAGAISGNVKDSNNRPIEGLWVHVFDNACGGKWLGGDHTDCNGDYIIGSLPSGDVYVQTCARCDGLNYVDEWWDNETDCNQASPVTVTVGAVTPDIDFVLEPAGSISGTVKDAENSPIEGIFVEACDNPCGPANWYGGACTDADGNYTLPGLSAGIDLYIRARACAECCSGICAPYVLEWWDESNGALDCNKAKPVTVVAGQTHTIDFVMEPGGNVSGTVTDDGGIPIEGLLVHAFDIACGGNWLGGDHTDENGNYTICGLPAEGCYVQTCASCEGLNYIDEWWDDTIYCDNATLVSVPLNSTHEDINFTLNAVPPCEGDFDHDGDVDGSDLAFFADAYALGSPKADLNNDGSVDADDVAVFAADFGRTDCPVCE